MKKGGKFLFFLVKLIIYLFIYLYSRSSKLNSKNMSSPAYESVSTDPDPCAKEHPDKGKYEGLVPARSTTDILLLALIICMWIAMTVGKYTYM